MQFARITGSDRDRLRRRSGERSQVANAAVAPTIAMDAEILVRLLPRHPAHRPIDDPELSTSATPRSGRRVRLSARAGAGAAATRQRVTLPASDRTQSLLVVPVERLGSRAEDRAAVKPLGGVSGEKPMAVRWQRRGTSISVESNFATASANSPSLQPVVTDPAPDHGHRSSWKCEGSWSRSIRRSERIP